MSCRAMDGGLGGLLIGGIIVGGILYSCGPNIVVGAAGSSIYGVKSCIDKVRVVWLEKQGSEYGGDSAGMTQAYIRWKVKCAQRKLDNDLHTTYCFAISMVPLIGAYLGMYASERGGPSMSEEDRAEDMHWKLMEQTANDLVGQLKLA